jgi:signal transduction histidine kinase
LTALVASSAVLDNQRDALTPRARAAAEILAGQLAHFQQLVLDLLDMSRMESGVDLPNLEPTDIGAFVERMVAARAAPRPCLHVESCPRVLTDRRRLERVLSNLLDNADAYAGGAVDVHVACEDEALRIMVDDAGPGISPDERDAIFQRMHRGTAARTSGSRGSGLGLALATESLRLLGGTIRAEDAPRGGARFVVELPLRTGIA